MDLEALWKERAADPAFRERDKDYKRFEDNYRKKGETTAPSYMNAKPLLIDGQNGSASPKLLNPSAQIVKHFAAMFSRLPRTSSSAFDASQEAVKLSNRMTALIKSVMHESGMQALQPLQAHRLSLRGDAVYGVEWDAVHNRIFWRGYDPAFCYPSMSDLDFGGVLDMLIHLKVNRKWARDAYGVDLDVKDKSKAKVWIYWDHEHKEVQVETHQAIPNHTFNHKLGFVPFRWVFAQPTGEFAQSDVQDVVDLSDTMNEAMVLALDSLRMNVYPAYWGKGLRENLQPLPGSVQALSSPEAEIHKFETAPPPEMTMNLLGEIQRHAQAAGGISPVSAEGMVGGSIVTGAAVRHQVEAIEARAETKRVVLEAAFARMAEYTLRVLESEFAEKALSYRKGEKERDVVKGSEVQGWTTCEADYGIVGMDFASRQRIALEGLGRVHDGYEAIRIAHPEADPAQMEARVIAYQIQQAEMTAQAQVSAQKIATAGQEQSQQPPPMAQPGGQPVAAPQPPSMPTPPVAGKFMQKLGAIQDALLLAADKLKGKVWAVGEMAITGMSSQPMIMVEKEKDLPIVNSLLASFKAIVTQGQPQDIPHITVT